MPGNKPTRRRARVQAKVQDNFSDEATRMKVRRHLSDINDVISENDIRNAKVPGIDEPGKLNNEEGSNGPGR